MPHDLPIACTLDAPDLAARLAEMAALGRDALSERRVDGSHARLRFAARPGVRDRVGAIVAAESACCAFLTFRVTDEPDAVVLDVDAPEGAGPVLAAWAGAFGAATRRRT